MLTLCVYLTVSFLFQNKKVFKYPYPRKSMKKVVVLLLIFVFLISLISGVVLAQTNKGSMLCTTFGWGAEAGISKDICDRLAYWEDGISFQTENYGVIGVLLKYIFLFLIIILIYSALASAKFPKNVFLRFLIAIIAGFLVTFMISKEEIITAMTSYTALGIALIVFFPILVLGFFTLVVACKASPMGIFIQRILWLIYSVYLFIKAGTVAWLKYSMTTNGVVESFDIAATEGQAASKVLQYGNGKVVSPIIQFFVGKNVDVLNSFENADNTILIILFVVAIAVFVIMVVSEKPIIAWLAKEKIEAEVEAQKSTIERSKAYDKARAEAMQNQ